MKNVVGYSVSETSSCYLKIFEELNALSSFNDKIALNKSIDVVVIEHFGDFKIEHSNY